MTSTRFPSCHASDDIGNSLPLTGAGRPLNNQVAAPSNRLNYESLGAIGVDDVIKSAGLN